MGLLEKLLGRIRPGLPPVHVSDPEHRWEPIRPGYEKAGPYVCKCGALGVRSLKAGKNTVTMGPASGVDVIRWSASFAPVSAGDIGMDVVTGRIRQFVGGVVQDVANLADIAGGLTFVQAQNDSSGIFTSSTVAPTYTAVPSPTLGITQVALGTCLFVFQATDALDASLRSGTAFAVRLDGGTFFPLTWATSSGAGNAIIFQHSGFRLFTGVAAGVHTLELGIALNGTVGPSIGVRRETAAPLRLLAIHT